MTETCTFNLCSSGMYRDMSDSDVGDLIMVTDFRQNQYVDYLFRYVGDFFLVIYRSPTS